MGFIFFRTLKNNNVRYVEYDFIRTCAMAMVLLLHTVFAFLAPVAKEPDELWWFEQISAIVLYTANILFFMLSGKFTLKTKFDTISDYKNFYLKRLYKIILPTFLYSALYYIINFYFGRLLGNEQPYKFTFTTIQNIQIFFTKFTSGTVSSHFWFIYTLVGIYLISPFIAKLVQKISISELICLNAVLFGFQFFCVFCDIFEIPLAIDNLGMTSYTPYFILGYSLDRIFRTYKSRIILVLLGIISLCISILEAIYLRGYNIHLTDFSPNIVLTTCALYIILYRIMKINRSFIIQHIFTFFSKHSLSFYCLHYLILYEVLRYFPLQQDLDLAIKSILVVFVIVFFITTFLSFLCDSIILNPLINVLTKSLNRKENFYNERDF